MIGTKKCHTLQVSDTPDNGSTINFTVLLEVFINKKKLIIKDAI